MDGGVRFKTDHYESLRVGFRRDTAEAERLERLHTETGYEWYAAWAAIYRRGAEHYAEVLKERGLHV